MQKLTPFLWFDSNAEEAVNYYMSVFPDGQILDVKRYGEAGPGPAGTVMTMSFKILNQEFSVINGGPHMQLSPATSWVIACEDQAEVDHYWEKLGEGGQIQQCGWLTDRFNVTWQVVPKRLFELLGHPDSATANRVMAAMMEMIKIDIAGLEAAATAA